MSFNRCLLLSICHWHQFASVYQSDPIESAVL